jgi:hypothetical protein
MVEIRVITVPRSSSELGTSSLPPWRIRTHPRTVRWGSKRVRRRLEIKRIGWQDQVV